MPVPLRHVSVAPVVWPGLQVPSIPAQTQSQHRQYLLEPALGSGTKGPGPATNRSTDTQTKKMRNPAFLPKFFLLGWARILPRAAGREALKGFELSLPSSLAPGLAGQAWLRLELASGFRGPARGRMLPLPRPRPFFSCEHRVWLGSDRQSQ